MTRCGVVEVQGDADLHACPDLRRASYEGRRAGCIYLIYDLRSTRYLDSTALAVLFQMHRRLEAEHGSACFVSACPGVRRLLEEAGLASRAPLATTIEEALQALAALRGPSGPTTEPGTSPA
jgi:anti-anti-sigma factor